MGQEVQVSGSYLRGAKLFAIIFSIRVGGGGIWGDQTQEHPLFEELGHVSRAEAAHQIKPVDFNGSDADIQLFSDFPIRVPLRHESKNFFLTSGQ